MVSNVRLELVGVVVEDDTRPRQRAVVIEVCVVWVEVSMS